MIQIFHQTSTDQLIDLNDLPLLDYLTVPPEPHVKLYMSLLVTKTHFTIKFQLAGLFVSMIWQLFISKYTNYRIN